MPCKTYDELVKIQSWEFGSSPTQLKGGVRGNLNHYVL